MSSTRSTQLVRHVSSLLSSLPPRIFPMHFFQHTSVNACVSTKPPCQLSQSSLGGGGERRGRARTRLDLGPLGLHREELPELALVLVAQLAEVGVFDCLARGVHFVCLRRALAVEFSGIFFFWFRREGANVQVLTSLVTPDIRAWEEFWSDVLARTGA